jgi:hypothetical protein
MPEPSSFRVFGLTQLPWVGHFRDAPAVIQHVPMPVSISLTQTSRLTKADRAFM